MPALPFRVQFVSHEIEVFQQDFPTEAEAISVAQLLANGCTNAVEVKSPFSLLLYEFPDGQIRVFKPGADLVKFDDDSHPTYSHAYTIGFEVRGSRCPRGEDVTPQMLHDSIVRMAKSSLHDGEIMTACKAPLSSRLETEGGEPE